MRLTLLWAVAHVLGALAPEIAHRFLARMRRDAGLILIARALLRMRMPPHAARAHVHLLRCRRHSISKRRILGAAFRCAIRARGVVAQAKAIADLLARAETWIAKLMRRRLSRLALRRPSLHTSHASLPVMAHAAASALDSS